MPSIKDIKHEIMTSIHALYIGAADFQEIVSQVERELEVLGSTTGLESKNNLEVLYNIWKHNSGKVGEKNAINSWTAYYLGMTRKKPDGPFLATRRAFARVGFPDIDTDFDYENRNKIYEYIINKYGRENVGNIGTHGLLKFKSCVTRVAKALDVADAYHLGKDEYVSRNAVKVSEILFSFPKQGLMKVTDKEGKSHLVKNFDEAYEHSQEFYEWMEKYPGMKVHCKTIEGVFANFGFHAAGLVVSDAPLECLAPLRTAKEGVLATQFPNEDLELLGLIKFDILAISTLSVIKKTVQMVKANWSVEIPIEDLPISDQKTFELYRKGNLGGVFQCENYGMRKTMENIGVDRFEDIVAGLALYRPGPMDSIPEYCARKRGEKKVDYFDPVIERHVKPYLERTYGVLCYQEQVMQICNALAGFTITDGYNMIKAIGKKKEDLLKQYEQQFIDGCIKKGVRKEVAQNYWTRFITPFSSYGFNLAHSACYGYNSYTTAYLKANHPAEFVCSFLEVTINSSQGTRYDKITEFEKEFQKTMDIKILRRDINKSKVAYTIERIPDPKNGVHKSEIRPSLLCKGIGPAAAQNIEENQPYETLKDFVIKTNSSVVDTRVFEALVDNGYFGSKAKENKVQRQKEFLTLRSDIKKIEKKGMESSDIFSS